MRKRQKIAIIWLALWMLSLFLPVVATESDPQQFTSGWYILLTGGFYIITEMQCGWAANLVFILAINRMWSRERSNKYDFITSVLIAAFTIDALFWRDATFDHLDLIQAFGPGYYLWLATMLGAAASLIGTGRLPQEGSTVLMSRDRYREQHRKR
jgi:hypothetical protein